MYKSSRTLILDNYDSFTFNLVQAVAAISGIDPLVVRNDEISWEELKRLEFGNVIISPGPGRPENPRDFGICRRVIEELDCPILGVCLGHQGICLAFGGRIVRAAEPVHGRPGAVFHNSDPLFDGVPDGFSAVRYHSLIAVDLPDCLEKIAWSGDGEVMGVRHRTRPIRGVQFHPESVCTEFGNRILANFLGELPNPKRNPAAIKNAADIFRRDFASAPYAFWLDGGPDGVSYVGSGTQIISGPDALEKIARELDQRRIAPDPDLPPFQGGWVGYWGYPSGRHASPYPEMCFIAVDQFVAAHGASGKSGKASAGPLTFAIEKHDYISKVDECLEAIRAGESYEVCLTNQLRGTSNANPLDYFERLRELNPSAYGAYFQHPDFQVACSSPELFLNITPEGHVTSKPIKGTAPRSSDPAALAADEKTRAENLMIVDLLRNDLGRVCKTGSVRVTNLMDIETFATVHHMV
ncbi:MAG TPA: chorismate-binding protein, partial [Bryobacteraceae bacterium]|nr:chorismate-binding protein [Bryobacteraceae bacterium]